MVGEGNKVLFPSPITKQVTSGLSTIADGRHRPGFWALLKSRKLGGSWAVRVALRTS